MMTGTITVSGSNPDTNAHSDPDSDSNTNPDTNAHSNADPFHVASFALPAHGHCGERADQHREACVSILDGPCTYMWTYGGTYPGLMIRRPTGQTHQVTFTNNLPALAGEMTVHHHGNHSAPERRWPGGRGQFPLRNRRIADLYL